MSFIAAVQVIATAHTDPPAHRGRPGPDRRHQRLTDLAAAAGVPRRAGATTRHLSAFNGWLRRNGRMILAGTLVAAGLIVAIDRLVGLIRKD
jgi:hypothetical protein